MGVRYVYRVEIYNEHFIVEATDIRDAMVKAAPKIAAFVDTTVVVRFAGELR